MKTTRTPTTICSCGMPLDAASSAHRTPKEGDLSLCAYCGRLGAFDQNLHLKEVDEKDLPLSTQEEIAAVRRTCKQWVTKKGGN